MNFSLDFLRQTVDIFGYTFQYWMIVGAAFIFLGLVYLFAVGKDG